MNDIGAQVKELRKQLGITQHEFGDQIGIKRNSVALIESGRPTSQQTINSIVRAYHVSEEWLRTGEGDMYGSDGDPIDVLGRQYNLTPGIVGMIKRLVQMPRSTQELLINELDAIVEAAKMAAEKADTTEEEENRMSAADMHAELDRQLEEQQRTGGESSAPSAIA